MKLIQNWANGQFATGYLFRRQSWERNKLWAGKLKTNEDNNWKEGDGFS